MNVLEDDYKKYAAQYGIEGRDLFPTLTWKILSSETHGYPLLSLACKAMQTRKGLRYAYHLAKRLYDTDDTKSTISLLRYTIAWTLLRYNQICDSQVRDFDDDQLEDVKACAKSFLILYSAMARIHTMAGINKYRLVPEFHGMYHIFEDQAAIENPAWNSAYADEDFMGIIASIGQECPSANWANNVIERYAWMACDNWAEYI